MATPVPTNVGDVLILKTGSGLKIHAVGCVTRRGQQDFHAVQPPLYIVDRDEAIAAARTLARPGQRVFLVQLDSHDWEDVSK